MKHTPGHHNRGMEAQGTIVPPGEGYRERDATTSTMDPDVAEDIVFGRREQELANVERRAEQIVKGLRHESEAAKRDRARYRGE